MPSTTITDQRISIEDFPDELLYKIIEFCNSSLALMALRRSSARFWHLLASPSAFNFRPWRPMRDICIKKTFDIHFTQEGDDILDFLYDHQVLLRDGEGELASVKFMGARTFGDRCCYSRFPLNSQSGLLKHHSKANHVSAYFEIQVREASHPGSNLRIGLVRGDASSYHPPGSGPYGVGYQSSSGYICLSAHDGDKFQFGPPWKAGDTVGCGYARDSTGHFIVYFTLNGQWVGDAPFDISGQKLEYKGPWHAAISSSTPAQVSVNVGQAPFKFDLHIGNLPSFLISRHSALDSQSIKSLIVPKKDIRMIANVIPSSSDPFLPATITSNGTIIFPDNGFEMARSALSSVPISHTLSSRFYFEITILEQGEGANSFLSMGLTVSPASPFHQIGWDRLSIGFHSDDGRVYRESNQNGLPYADPFTRGAVVGCGYEASEGLVYFTLNGSSLGTAATGFFGKFHGAVAAIRGWRVSVNFGTDPFMYDGTRL